MLNSCSLMHFQNSRYIWETWFATPFLNESFEKCNYCCISSPRFKNTFFHCPPLWKQIPNDWQSVSQSVSPFVVMAEFQTLHWISLSVCLWYVYWQSFKHSTKSSSHSVCCLWVSQSVSPFVVPALFQIPHQVSSSLCLLYVSQPVSKSVWCTGRV